MEGIDYLGNLKHYIHNNNENPILSEGGTFPQDFLKLHHSWAFDCKSLYNLAVVDANTILYSTGSYLHVFNIKNGQMQCHRSWGRGGISRIASHPRLPYIAIAECGKNPSILICSWPAFLIHQTLQSGAQQAFTYLEFSPNGELLASQASAPDFNLTIWKWEKAEVFLQAKCFERPVFYAHFSEFHVNQLVSSGDSHIKFWYMDNTFTGQKLHGELGRFGKKDPCNLISALPLPDGSIASGSKWGNILIWDEGSIKLEVHRNGWLPCHNGEISQMIFSNGALLSVGLDGAIRQWNYDNIELADPLEDAANVEMEPLFEIIVKDGNVRAQLSSMVKADTDPESTIWYSQDFNGAIWRIDVSTALEAERPKIILSSHAGPVLSLQAAPADNWFATLGTDGKIYIYDYLTKTVKMSREFYVSGTCLLWIPLSIEPSGKTLLAGFEDGVIRLLGITQNTIEVVQAVKPHTAAVTKLGISHAPSQSIVASGSMDGTIYLFRILLSETVPLQLETIGSCLVGAAVTCLTWTYSESLVLYVGCADGKLLQFNIPQNVLPATPKSTRIEITPKEISLEMVVKAVQMQGDEEDVKIQLTSNEGSLSSMEEDSMDLSSPVLFLWSSTSDTIWFSYKNPFSGVIFEMNANDSSHIEGFNVQTNEDGVIHCGCYSKDLQSIFLGFSNGNLAALRVNQPSVDYWYDQVHRLFDGAIRQIACSFDSSFIFTCGDDGAVFSFRTPLQVQEELPKTIPYEYVQITPDIDGKSTLSLEEACQKLNQDAKIRAGEQHQKMVIEKISVLSEKYSDILERNKKLPDSVKLKDNDLIVDNRVLEGINILVSGDNDEAIRKLAPDSERSKLQLKKLRDYLLEDLETLEVQVYGILIDDYVSTFRLRKLGQHFFEILRITEKSMEELDAKGGEQSALKPVERHVESLLEGPNAIETLLKQVAVIGDVEKNYQLSRIYERYRKRRSAEAARAKAWQEIILKMPEPEKMDPADLNAFEVARENLGDISLKTSSDYKVVKHLKMTKISKTLAVLRAKIKLYDMKNDFNSKVLALRGCKQDMIQKHTFLRSKLDNIKKCLPLEMGISPPELPTFNRSLEFPEEALTLDESSLIPRSFKRRGPSVGRQAEGKSPRANLRVGKINSMDFSQLQKLEVSDVVETSWETELIEKEELSLLQMQDHIISEMNEDIAKFDADIRALRNEKVKLRADVKFFEHHFVTLSREVIVLQDFEGEESKKSEIALKHLKQKEELQKVSSITFKKIDLGLKEIQANEEEVRCLTNEFLTNVANNKFADFLKKIFKKKYKPPKQETDDNDDTSSSGSDSDTDEADDKSLESKEFDISRIIENVCPPGCDKEIYDWTFLSRAQRHQLELKITNKKKEVEVLRKQFDVCNKEIQVVEKAYAAAQIELEALQRKKQVKLNEIETLVLLRMSQIQNIKNEVEITDIEQSVVIAAPLLSKLYYRVGELEKETKHQKEKHSMNHKHLQRMSIDINHMNKVIKEKEKEIDETMIKKFGSKVDLNELEESLLKKLVAEMNYIPFEMEKALTKKLWPLKEELIERQIQYKARLHENTERCNIIALLKEEKSRIERILDRQELEMSMPIKEEDNKDLEKLEEMVRRQENKLARARAELYLLKYKTRPNTGEAYEELISESQGPPTQILIRSCDGKYVEISESLRLELKSLAEDIEEYTADIEGGFVTEEGTDRLRDLVNEFMMKIPAHCKQSILEKLSEDVVEEDAYVESVDGLVVISKFAVAMVGTIVGPFNEKGEDN